MSYLSRRKPRLGEEQIHLIKYMHEKGFKPRFIAAQVRCSVSTVKYHTQDNIRESILEHSRKNSKPYHEKNRARRLRYMSQYQKERYEFDADFRERVKSNERVRQKMMRMSK